MGSDSCLFGVGHVFSRLVAYQERNLPFTAAGLFADDPHFFHVEVHADLYFLLKHFQHLPFYPLDLSNGLALLVLCVQVKVVDGHCTDGLAVEGLDILHLPTDSSALHNRLLDVEVAEEGLFSKLLAPFLENDHAGEFLPDLEVLLPSVEPEVINPVEAVEYFLLLQKLLELQELNLVVEVLGESSLGNHHVFGGIPFVKFHDLPVIRVASPVHIAELF